MSAVKERYQNPTCGDTLNLRLFTYNSNNRSDVQSIQKVDIIFLDPTLKSDSNPQGARVVQTIDGSNIVQEATGQYLLQLTATSPLYTIGDYIDVWSVVFDNGDCSTAQIQNHFRLYPQLWFTTPIPPIYDFGFAFRPNRVRKGTKRYLLVQVTPNVPRGTDLQPYYENLAIVSDLRVSIELACGECVPTEQDLRLLVDRAPVDYREKLYGYYFLDTTDYDPGIYNVWFELAFGENVFVSEKNQLEIFD
jgi:hypothetical protein